MKSIRSIALLTLLLLPLLALQPAQAQETNNALAGLQGGALVVKGESPVFMSGAYLGIQDFPVLKRPLHVALLFGERGDEEIYLIKGYTETSRSLPLGFEATVLGGVWAQIHSGIPPDAVQILDGQLVISEDDGDEFFLALGLRLGYTYQKLAVSLAAEKAVRTEDRPDMYQLGGELRMLF